MNDTPGPNTTAKQAARANWNADRKALSQKWIGLPQWVIPAWSRAPAWRKRPYILAAQHGMHPDDV